MIEIVWEFTAQEGKAGQFELLFGPGGAWGRLFAQADGFRGTTLMRDTLNENRFLVIEVWDTQNLRDTAIEANPDAFTALQAQFKALSETQTELGTFEVRAQGAVRPQKKPKSKRNF